VNFINDFFGSQLTPITLTPDFAEYNINYPSGYVQHGKRVYVRINVRPTRQLSEGAYVVATGLPTPAQFTSLSALAWWIPYAALARPNNPPDIWLAIPPGNSIATTVGIFISGEYIAL